jgi:hypothetical protein
VSADERRALGGLEFVQRLVTGALPLNTMARTLGYNIAEATAGRVVVTADPSGDHLNPAGTVHGGFAATLLDPVWDSRFLLQLERASAQRHWNSRSHFCDL